MKVNDSIFGEVDIDVPVIVDLINSKPVQRLRGINSGGPCQYIHEGLQNESETRFGHSVGVMLMLRHFKASLFEQIAGLLHDVSHTAFSHAGDYVFGSPHTQGYQDSILDQFILQSEIPQILARHGLKAEEVLPIHKFTLLEQEIPDLCADRLDYSLRHPFIKKYLAPLRPLEVLDYLTVQEGKFVMTSPIVAWKYALAFSQWYIAELAGPRCIGGHEILAQAIKKAMALGALGKTDMFKDDAYVMQKLKQSKDEEIVNWVSCLRLDFDCVVDEINPNLTGGVKNRYIDPHVLISNALVRVSKLYPDFARELEEQKKKLHKTKIPIRIISKGKTVQKAGIV